MGKLAQVKKSRSVSVAPAKNTAIRFYDDSGNEIAVTQQDVLQFICPKATLQEVTFFMELCRAQRLNPFLREAFLVKYGTGPASMITAEIVFERRANAHPDYRGMEAGVVFMTKDGKVDKRQGTATYKAAGETLIGGWACVHRKGRTDTYAEVSLDEYDRKQSLWRSMPGVMIQKCAKGVALRQAFPTDFQGMFLEEEMGEQTSVTEIHDAVVEPTSQPEEPSVPTDDEKSELRDLTAKCVALGAGESETKKALFSQWQQGGMDAARGYATSLSEEAEIARLAGRCADAGYGQDEAKRWLLGIRSSEGMDKARSEAERMIEDAKAPENVDPETGEVAEEVAADLAEKDIEF